MDDLQANIKSIKWKIDEMRAQRADFFELRVSPPHYTLCEVYPPPKWQHLIYTPPKIMQSHLFPPKNVPSSSTLPPFLVKVGDPPFFWAPSPQDVFGFFPQKYNHLHHHYHHHHHHHHHHSHYHHLHQTHIVGIV